MEEIEEEQKDVEDDEEEDEENWRKVVVNERKEQLMKLCAEPRVLDAAFRTALSVAAECLAPKTQPAVKAKPQMPVGEKKCKDDKKKRKEVEKKVEKKGEKEDENKKGEPKGESENEKNDENRKLKLTPSPPNSPPPRDPVMSLGLYFFQSKKRYIYILII